MVGSGVILLIEADVSPYVVFIKRLNQCGFRVDLAGNAIDAFEFVRRKTYDMVLMDINLPDADGIGLLAMLRRLRPLLPVLILTCDESVDITMHALRLGASGYLYKPVSPDQLIDCIQQVLKEQHYQLGHGPAKIRPARIRRNVLDELE